MKIKHNLNNFNLLDCYNEKLNALNKLSRGAYRISKLQEEITQIERTSKVYMDYVARLDKKIGEIHKKGKILA